jgi:YVTN family beta-propeller protein
VLAYVTNFNENTVSVIDTGDNSVVDTVQVGSNPSGIAVAPDGRRVYVLNAISNSVSVIKTMNETNTLLATIPVGNGPAEVAITPDGTRAYVTNEVSNNVSVINTANNDVMTTVAVGTNPLGIAVTPDGNHVYVVNSNSGGAGSVSVIDTTTNKVVYTIIPAANDTEHIAITPDGTRAYLSSGFGSLLVIDTTTNQVITTIPTGQGLNSLDITPDGMRIYVLNTASEGEIGSVLVIDTGTNKVVDTITPVNHPFGIAFTPDGTRAYLTTVTNFGGLGVVFVIDTGTNEVVSMIPGVGNRGGLPAIIPPPQGILFLSFSAKLDVDLDRKSNRDDFELKCSFILNSEASNGIHPDAEPVKIQVGPFITTIPAGSFRKSTDGSYTYEGVIDGVGLEAQIKLMGNLRYAFTVEARGANLSGIANPVQVSLGIGDDAGLTFVQAHFDWDSQASNN